MNGNIVISDSDINHVLTYNIDEHPDGSKPKYYDAVIAFSQGCLAANLLIASNIISTSKLLLFSPIPAPVSWKYIIKDNTVQADVYVGENDDLVTPEQSLLFISMLGLNDIKIIKHRWGHVIPTSKEYKILYHEFLNK